MIYSFFSLPRQIMRMRYDDILRLITSSFVMFCRLVDARGLNCTLIIWFHLRYTYRHVCITTLPHTYFRVNTSKKNFGANWLQDLLFYCASFHREFSFPFGNADVWLFIWRNGIFGYISARFSPAILSFEWVFHSLAMILHDVHGSNYV